MNIERTDRSNRYWTVLVWRGPQNCSASCVAVDAGRRVQRRLVGGRRKLIYSHGPDGITCRFLVAAGRMAWQQPGGDWIDAAGKAFGPAAHATAEISRSQAGQRIGIDVTTLARAWQNGDGPAGAMFLTSGPAASKGGVRFHSRESDDATTRPLLRVVWTDGRVEELKAAADATLNCTTVRSLGGGTSFSVGRKRKLRAGFSVCIASRPKHQRGTVAPGCGAKFARYDDFHLQTAGACRAGLDARPWVCEGLSG